MVIKVVVAGMVIKVVVAGMVIKVVVAGMVRIVPFQNEHKKQCYPNISLLPRHPYLWQSSTSLMAALS